MHDIKDFVTGESGSPVILICAGGDNVAEQLSGELFRKYNATLTRVNSRSGTPLGCGILPRIGAGQMWLSRVLSVKEC